jgi:hypothetical protein
MDAKQYLASLPAWDEVQRLDAFLAHQLDKEDLLAAEVSLPLASDVDVSSLRLTQLRRPHELCSLPLLVDVSRLSAP